MEGKFFFFFFLKGALFLGLQPLPPAWSCRHCGWEEQGIAKMENKKGFPQPLAPALGQKQLTPKCHPMAWGGEGGVNEGDTGVPHLLDGPEACPRGC